MSKLVNTKTVLDMSGHVLNQEGCWYENFLDQSIAGLGGGGGGDKEIPETPEEQELADISAEKWQRYQDVFKPLENEYMAEVDEMGGQAAQDRVTGQAATSVQQGVGDMPADPNAGAPMGGAGAQLGQARAGAVTDAATGLRGQHIQGMQGLVAMGQGQSADSMQSMGDIAGRAASDAMQDTKQEAFRDFNRRNAWANMAGQAAGIGTSYAMGSGGGTSQQTMLNEQNQGWGLANRATRTALASNPNKQGV